MLSQWTMTCLDAGIEDTQVHNVIIPAGLADGEYHLGVKADAINEVDEFNEDNNLFASQIWVGAGGEPGGNIELQADRFQANNTEPVIWGGSINIDADVKNMGDTDAGAFDVSVYLSQDNIPDGSDTVLHNFTINSLAAGGTIITNNFNTTLPGTGTDGDYYLIMSVDSGHVIDEPNEDDNIWIAPINVGSGGGTGGVDLNPDEELFNPPYDLVWGEQYEFPADAINAGDGGADAFTISIVLSEDGVYDGSDFALGSVGVASIGPWGDSINDVMITLPTAGTYADGNYNIIMFVDSAGAVEETNEDNNVAVNPVTIAATANLIEGIDLVAVMFDDAMAGDYQWGQSYVVAADVLNAGDTDAGAFTIKVALSEDMTFDASD
ncbi:MAG: hypothetical protein KAT56_00925, partial [Sedimentisphaerales bacterium]|nr:hypothetical protein [Sedimentisphaerales bacterium]